MRDANHDIQREKVLNKIMELTLVKEDRLSQYDEPKFNLQQSEYTYLMSDIK